MVLLLCLEMRNSILSSLLQNKMCVQQLFLFYRKNYWKVTYLQSTILQTSFEFSCLKWAIMLYPSDIMLP